MIHAFAVYENARCNNCRNSVVEELHRAKALPQWVLTEMKFDNCCDDQPNLG
jgi:hypothetical protein